MKTKTQLLKFVCKCILSFFLLGFLQSAFALALNIVPQTALPTTVPDGGLTLAYYTVSNNTLSARLGNHVTNLPPNVTQSTLGTGVCGTTFNFTPRGTAGSSCLLRLIITGPVDAKDPKARNHLLVCFPGDKVCAGTTSELNVSTGAAPSMIVVTPANGSVIRGNTLQMTATAAFGDTSSDMTTTVNWTSSDPTIATVNETGLVTSVGNGVAAITATSGSTSGSTTVTVKTLQSVTISAANNATGVRVANTLSYTATGFYTDESTVDLTNAVTWSSSNTSLATVTSGGVVTGKVGGGPLQIRASYLGLTITPQNLTVYAVDSLVIDTLPDPNNFVVFLNTTLQMTVAGHYLDGGPDTDFTKAAIWTSSNMSNATIVANTGVVTGKAFGSTTIGVTYLGKNQTKVVSVAGVDQITVDSNPSGNTNLISGFNQQFKATAVATSAGQTQDVTTSVTWATSDPSLATVSATGLVSAIASGTPSITATYTAGTQTVGARSISIKTLSRISLTPLNPTISARKANTQFTATGTYDDTSAADITSKVIFASSNPSAVTITTGGLATTKDSGMSTITATQTASPGASSEPSVITVTPILTGYSITPAAAGIIKGYTQQFTGTATYSDGTTSNVTSSATWGIATQASITMGASTGLATAISNSNGIAYQVTSSFTPATGAGTQMSATPATAEVIVPIGILGGVVTNTTTLGIFQKVDDGNSWVPATFSTTTPTISNKFMSACTGNYKSSPTCLFAINPVSSTTSTTASAEIYQLSITNNTWARVDQTLGFNARDISCTPGVSSAWCVVVGSTDASTTGVPVIRQRINGTTWSTVTVPSMPTSGVLQSVNCFGTGSTAACYALGIRDTNVTFIVKSTNGGTSWSAADVTGSIGGLKISCTGSTGSSNVCMYINGSDNPNSSIYQSNDGGAFSPITNTIISVINPGAATLVSKFWDVSCTGGGGADSVCMLVGNYYLNGASDNVRPIQAVTTDKGLTWAQAVDVESDTTFQNKGARRVSCNRIRTNAMCLVGLIDSTSTSAKSVLNRYDFNGVSASPAWTKTSLYTSTISSIPDVLSCGGIGSLCVAYLQPASANQGIFLSSYTGGYETSGGGNAFTVDKSDAPQFSPLASGTSGLRN